MRTPEDCEVFWLDTTACPPADNQLSSDERSHARAFRRPEDRAAFVATRAALRGLLGRRVGIAPASLVFVNGEHGKPRLRDGGLHFNVAHCDGHAVIALRSSGPVGVDVEIVPETLPERDQIASRVLSSRERDWLLERPEAARTRDFMRLWVLKEAFAKCLGVGLSGPLQDLEVELGEDEPRVRWLDHAERTFVAADLAQGDGFAAALVAEVSSPPSP